MCIRDRYTDDPHPRNTYWEMWGLPMFDIKDAVAIMQEVTCLLYTSDAADERSSVDLGGRRIIKKKTTALHRSTVTRRHTMKPLDQQQTQSH